MSVFTTTARGRADRIAALVGLAAFVLGIGVIAWGAVATPTSTSVATTVVSTPLPGEPVTTTTRETAPPVNATREPRVTQTETITEGAAPGTVTITTGPPPPRVPWLGSVAADLAFQVILVTGAAFLLAFATHRVLLGRYGRSANATDSAGGVEPVTEADALAIKRQVAAAAENPDLSRPLFERVPVPDPRMRLIQSRISLELAVRTLAQDNDLPSSLSVPYVLAGLVEKKRMSSALSSAIEALHRLGDRLGHGAEISLDTTTLLTEAYSQALAKVGGTLRAPRRPARMES